MITVFPSYTITGFIAAALVLIPLPRQIRVRNIATITMTFWFFQHCFAISVNTIVWRGNVIDVAPVWCDITSSLRDGVGIALPACTLCICKHLEFISSRRAITAENVKLRRRIFESAMCIALPAFWIFVGYCFRLYRYVIFEDFGCYSSAAVSNAYVIVFIAPSLALSVITLIYGTIALYHIFGDHKANIMFLTPHLKSRGGALSGAQYYRYMIMSMVLGIWGIVWFSIEIQTVVTPGISPLPNWNIIHRKNHISAQLPTVLISPSFLNFTLLLWWAVPGAAYIYFVLFGTSWDVLAEYPRLWLWVRTKVLRLPPPVRSEVTSLTAFTIPRSGFPTHIDNTIITVDLESRAEDVSPSKSFHSIPKAMN